MHLPTRFALLAFLPLLTPLTGCGASGPSRPAVEFPSRTEVAQLPSKKAPIEAFGTTDAHADEWAFEAAPAADDAAYADTTPWGTVLTDLLRGAPKLTPSAALRCAAQEIARFHRLHRALPDEGLRRFTVARCGATVPAATPLVWYAEVPAGYTDAQITGQARQALAPLLAKVAPRGRGIIGLAADREGAHVSVVAVVADEEARLEPGSHAADANGHVVVRGTAGTGFSEVVALVNRGESSFGRCVADPHVVMPRFALTCELAPGDSYAWIEVLGQRAGHMLLSSVADLLAYGGDPSAIVYRPRKVGPSAPVHEPDDLVRAIVAGVNGVRKEAKLAPLTLAAKQSAENARLAGTLISASVSHDDDTGDRAAIGLLAGWEVDGTIRSGNFFLAAVGPTRDAESWLELALERPIGRFSLLDPDARSIAVGPVVPEEAPALGAAVTTYGFFESTDHTADTKRFCERIAAARAAHGLPAPTLAPGLSDEKEEVELVRKGEKSSMDALQELLTSASGRFGISVRGYVLETNDIEHVEVPKELLTPGPLSARIVVTHHRVEGAAWGQYVIFAVLVDAGQAPTREARATMGDGAM